MSGSIRRAALTDVDLVAPLFDGYRVFYEKKSDLALACSFLRERLSASEAVVFVAFDEAQAPIGFTLLYPLFSSVNAWKKYLLNDLYIVPAARRGHVGAQLLGAAAEFARAQGAGSMSLSTGVANLAAQRLYESQRWVRDDSFYEYNFVL